ncbi:MAG: septum site-determining protein MinD [Aminivibrio sp.]
MDPRVIVITSGKGGVGKTTTTSNISVALARAGHKVVAVDADIGLRNLDVMMGLENRVVYNFIDVLEGTCRLNQALVRDKRVDNLFLLPAAQTRTKDAVTPDQMEQLCALLRREFDFILLDSPAGIEGGFKNAAAGADEAIVLTTPEVPAVRDADRIIGLLESMGKAPIRLVINRLRGRMVSEGEMLDVRDVLDVLAVDLLGIVPEDDSVVKSSNRGEPLAFGDDAPAAKAFTRIAGRLRGENIPFPDFSEEQGRGFLAGILKLFGMKG